MAVENRENYINSFVVKEEDGSIRMDTTEVTIYDKRFPDLPTALKDSQQKFRSALFQRASLGAVALAITGKGVTIFWEGVAIQGNPGQAAIGALIALGPLYGTKAIFDRTQHNLIRIKEELQAIRLFDAEQKSEKNEISS